MCCKQTQLEVAMLASIFVDRSNRYIRTASGSGQNILTVYLFACGRQVRGKVRCLESC